MSAPWSMGSIGTGGFISASSLGDLGSSFMVVCSPRQKKTYIYINIMNIYNIWIYNEYIYDEN